MEKHAFVAVTMADGLCCSRVSHAAEAVRFKCAEFPSEADLLSKIGKQLPEVLVMQLSGDGHRQLKLQEHFQKIFVPLVIVYVAAQPEIEAITRGVQLGAVAVLPPDCSLEKLSEVLLTAAEIHRVRAQWIGEILSAQKRLHALSERQRLVMSYVVSGQTNKAISLQLDISVKTVEKHRHGVHRRTNTASIADLVRLSIVAERPQGLAYGIHRADFSLCNAILPNIAPPATTGYPVQNGLHQKRQVLCVAE